MPFLQVEPRQFLGSIKSLCGDNAEIKIVYFFAGLIMGGKNHKKVVQNDNCIGNFDCCSSAKTRVLCFSALKKKMPLFTICFASMFDKTLQISVLFKGGPRNPCTVNSGILLIVCI